MVVRVQIVAGLENYKGSNTSGCSTGGGSSSNKCRISCLISCVLKEY